jgi:integrase
MLTAKYGDPKTRFLSHTLDWKQDDTVIQLFWAITGDVWFTLTSETIKNSHTTWLEQYKDDKAAPVPVVGRWSVRKEADAVARPKSRGNGEGSIYLRSDGRWCAAITIGYDSNGKLRRRVIYGRTRKEVADKLIKLQHDQALGKPIEPHKVTVAQHFADWLTEKKLRTRPGTWKRDESHIRNHIVPALGHTQLQQLSFRQISRFYLALRDETQLAPRTIHDIATILRSGLRDAVKKGLLATNPAEQLAKPKYERKEARFLNKQELSRFLEAARGERLEELFILLVNTGLRPGEALGLSWESVDLERGQLTVRQALTETNGHLAIGEVKTLAGRRTISLPEVAIQALRRQRKRQLEDRLAAGNQWDNKHNLVFTNPSGRWLRRSYVGRTPLRRILQRAGIKGITLHSFRHTHASLLIEQGMDIKAIASRLGHEDRAVTLQTYGHLMPGQDERAAKVMDDLFSSLGL